MKRVAFVLVALLCGVVHHPLAHTPSEPLPIVAWGGGHEVALPLGFSATVDRATRAQFVHVVAGDVDRDGDIDVVASIGSLDLIVWKNDGAGHFTRQAAAPHLSLRQQPPAPSVDGDSTASNEWIQNDQPRGVDLDLFIQHWRSAFGKQLTRKQARILARREARLYAYLKHFGRKKPKATAR